MSHEVKETVHRILVVDDNPNIHKDFQTILIGEEQNAELESLRAEVFGGGVVEESMLRGKYELDFASQGKEGAKMVKESLRKGRPYELAFVDMRMPPGWDGLKTIERIWKNDPSIQIVICTAHSDYSWEQISERLGKSEKLLILKKPFDSVEVVQLASSLTEKWTLARQASMKMGQLEEMAEERAGELAKSNEQLEQEVVEREQAQDTSEKRIKELNCLYALSRLAEQPQVTLEQMFQETVNLIRAAYEEPEMTCVRITFKGLKYETDNFKKSELSQYTEIRMRGDKAGRIDVYWLGERRADGPSPFLPEERNLLGVVAERLGSIAGHKKAEDKLQLFRNLIKQSNDCIFVVEPKWGRFLDVNDRACESLGYAKEELLEMSIRDIDESIRDDSSWHQMAEELKVEGDIIEASKYKCKDARVFFVEASLKLVSQEEREYIIAVARDITERKRAEEKQSKLLKEIENANQELKDFAYIVSHDLKAPLRGIKTLAEWISTDYADKLDEEGKEHLALLSSRVERMHSLIEGILEYSRVGRVKEKQVEVDLQELVPQVIDMVAAPQNISITVEGELPRVVCEPTRIAQVFQNLLSNAVKYMDKPQGQISIGCVERDGFWQFSVADDGPGIEERHFEKIFQMFQTLSPRDEFESTGIGLTVIKKIVELYGGKIWVESKVGKGSTFFFTLPKQKIETANAKLEANIAY